MHTHTNTHTQHTHTQTDRQTDRHTQLRQVHTQNHTQSRQIQTCTITHNQDTHIHEPNSRTNARTKESIIQIRIHNTHTCILKHGDKYRIHLRTENPTAGRTFKGQIIHLSNSAGSVCMYVSMLVCVSVCVYM
jgi:hypothetical protein